VITNPMIMREQMERPVAKKWSDRADQVTVDKLCFCLVVDQGKLAGVLLETPEAAGTEGK